MELAIQGLILFLIVVPGSQSSSVQNYTNQHEVFKVAPAQNMLSNYCSQMNATNWVKCGVVPFANKKTLFTKQAGYGEFPWQVAVIDADKQLFLCGGALVTERHVLTSASCIRGRSELSVRLGDWDIMLESNPTEAFRSLEVPIVRRFVHPVFLASLNRRSYNHEHDIALLKLQYAVDFKQYPQISTICLPSGIAYDPTECLVAGWSQSQLQDFNMMQFDDLETSFHVADESVRVDFQETFPLYPQVEATSSKLSVLLQDGEKQLKKQKSGKEIANKGNEVIQLKERNSENTEDDDTGEPGVEGAKSRVLSKASVQSVGGDACIEKVQRFHNVSSNSSQLCVFSQGYNEECKADLGSAMVCKISSQRRTAKLEERSSDKYVAVGVVARKFGCSEDMQALIVAADIKQQMNFIKTIICSYK